MLLYKKKGAPEEEEIVLCRVDRIHENSVFVTLIEYINYTGLIPIFEVAPGRIRNIRDYVKQGKIVVCKVLSVDKNRNHVTLSLRRVNERTRKEKISWLKQEQDAEKILQVVANKFNINVNDLFKEIERLAEGYDSIYHFFEDVSKNNINIVSDKLSEDVIRELVNLIKERIKPQKVEVKVRINLICYKPNGVEIIRYIFKSILSINDENINVFYEAAGKYIIRILSDDYKKAESKLKEIINIIESKAKDNNCIFSYERIK